MDGRCWAYVLCFCPFFKQTKNKGAYWFITCISFRSHFRLWISGPELWSMEQKIFPLWALDICSGYFKLSVLCVYAEEKHLHVYSNDKKNVTICDPVLFLSCLFLLCNKRDLINFQISPLRLWVFAFLLRVVFCCSCTVSRIEKVQVRSLYRQSVLSRISGAYNHHCLC